MMASSNGNIFRVTGPLCSQVTGEFPSQRPVTRSFDVFFDFDLRPNKRLSKQSRGWSFETPSRSLWRHCSAIPVDDMVPYVARSSTAAMVLTIIDCIISRRMHNSHIWQSLSLRDWRWKAAVTLGWMGATFSGSSSWPPRSLCREFQSGRWSTLDKGQGYTTAWL